MEDILPYSKELKPYARKLRLNMTDCETILWSKIRRRQIRNIQFFRQKPVGTFILDFYAKHPKLCIELDGSQHYTKQHKEKDHNRDIYLNSLGIYVLRFDNLAILQNLAGVLEEIDETIQILTSPRSRGSRPPPKGVIHRESQ